MSATRFQLTWPDGVRIVAAMLRRKVAFPFSLCRAALCGALVLTGTHRSSAQPAVPMHPTLHGRVMVGYQGWFRAEGDGTNEHWWHYGQTPTLFDPDHFSIDYWPAVSELAQTYPAPQSFAAADGTVPHVYSGHDPATILTHFKWMQRQGIPGAFVQRFAVHMTDGGSIRDRTDEVLLAALDAARETGRSVAVMYDLSGLSAGKMDLVIKDWKHLVDDLGVPGKPWLPNGKPAYQWHEGRPVVGVYGIGFKDRAYTLAEVDSLITVLKGIHVPATEARYGGNTVVAGVANDWFAPSGDEDSPAEPQPRNPAMEAALRDMLKKVDIIMPWTIGRFKDMGEARAHIEKRWHERQWCEQYRIAYMPVVFPGASDVNLKVGRGEKRESMIKKRAEREDGRFLWEQYRWLAEAGCTMVYQAMFDEIDEGTQIFKISNNPPEKVKAKLLTYQNLPEDYYLRLVGRAAAEWWQKVFQRTPFPERIPPFRDPEAPDIDRYLRGNDKQKYDLAQLSYETTKSLDQIAVWVADYAPNQRNNWTSTWTPIADERERQPMKVLIVGNDWNARHTNAGKDRNASVTWEFVPRESGSYTLYVRHPGDRFQEHAKDAVLEVTNPVGGNPAWSPKTINLRECTMRFNKMGTINLVAKEAVQLKLSLPPGSSSGNLMTFEPRFERGTGNPPGYQLADPCLPAPTNLQIQLLSR